MKLVDMSHVVWDGNGVTFPGLGNCHGIVYATTAGLFAYHANLDFNASYNQNGKQRLKAFVDFVTTHPRFAGITPIGLYGLSPKSRPDDDVEGELRAVAEGLGYNGTIWTGRWKLADLGWGSTWVVFTRGLGQEIKVTIERYRSENDNEKPHVMNGDQGNHKLATNNGTVVALAQFAVPTRTDPDTQRDFTDWGKLLVPAVKKKGILTK